MKKHFINFSSLIVLIFLWSCNNSASPDICSTGSISIRINTSQNRTINPADSTTASDNSNKYEVLIYNNLTTLSTVIDLSSGSAILAAEAGTYTVLILAGYSNSSEGVLLGSGYQESVIVLQDQITDVVITLTSISHDYSVPISVACTDQYSVSLSGNTNNILLQISSGGSVMENRPFLEIGDSSTNCYLECTVPDSSWTGTITLTAPSTAETSAVKLYGSNIKLVDPAYSINDDLKNIGTVNWKWLNESIAPDTMTEEVNRVINFETASSGVAITVGWG